LRLNGFALRWENLDEDITVTVFKLTKRRLTYELYRVAKLPNENRANIWSNKMKKEYDFSIGERGKFYHADAEFNLPVYLDYDNLLFIEKIAKRKDSDLSTVVNELIRSDREIAKVIE